MSYDDFRDKRNNLPSWAVEELEEMVERGNVSSEDAKTMASILEKDEKLVTQWVKTAVRRKIADDERSKTATTVRISPVPETSAANSFFTKKRKRQRDKRSKPASRVDSAKSTGNQLKSITKSAFEVNKKKIEQNSDSMKDKKHLEAESEKKPKQIGSNKRSLVCVRNAAGRFTKKAKAETNATSSSSRKSSRQKLNVSYEEFEDEWYEGMDEFDKMIGGKAQKVTLLVNAEDTLSLPRETSIASSDKCDVTGGNSTSRDHSLRCTSTDTGNMSSSYSEDACPPSQQSGRERKAVSSADSEDDDETMAAITKMNSPIPTVSQQPSTLDGSTLDALTVNSEKMRILSPLISTTVSTPTPPNTPDVGEHAQPVVSETDRLALSEAPETDGNSLKIPSETNKHLPAIVAGIEGHPDESQTDYDVSETSKDVEPKETQNLSDNPEDMLPTRSETSETSLQLSASQQPSISPPLLERQSYSEIPATEDVNQRDSPSRLLFLDTVKDIPGPVFFMNFNSSVFTLEILCAKLDKDLIPRHTEEIDPGFVPRKCESGAIVTWAELLPESEKPEKCEPSSKKLVVPCGSNYKFETWTSAETRIFLEACFFSDRACLSSLLPYKLNGEQLCLFIELPSGTTAKMFGIEPDNCDRIEMYLGAIINRRNGYYYFD